MNLVDAAPSPTDRPHVLLMCTGSVATVKVRALIELLLGGGFDVKLVATQAAMHFIASLAPPDSPSSAAAHLVIASALTDADEWNQWSKRGDPVLHIQLRNWAHVAVIAPLDANSLAKLSHGICDNLLTCVMRAWEVGKKPVVLAPAMNTEMWKHPFTAPQLKVLHDLYSVGDSSNGLCCVVDPVVKMLECGDVGVGAMAEPHSIVSVVAVTLNRNVC